MIRYRFLSVAEQEMSEAAVFYEARTPGLGEDFLDDVQQVIARLRTPGDWSQSRPGYWRTRY